MIVRGLCLAVFLQAGPAFAQQRRLPALGQLQALHGEEPPPAAADEIGRPVERTPYTGGPERSKVSFTGSGMGFHVLGTFSRFTVEAELDKKDFTRSEIAVFVESGSIDCDGAPDWLVRKMLGVKKYPVMSFKSLAIRPLPQAGRFEVDVEVNSKGKTHPETIVVAMAAQDDGSVRLQGSIAKEGKLGKGALGFETILTESGLTLASRP